MNEKGKMIAGKIYDPNDSELLSLRQKAHLLCQKYNQIPETDADSRKKVLDELFGEQEEGLYLQGPIQFDYGVNTSFGKNCYANFNFVVLDVCPVKIGDDVFFGPNCSLYTPMHPLLNEERKMHLGKNGFSDDEYGKPITIGNGCWFAGNVTVIGGVHIGNGCVIGAGSVVTRDMPDGYLCYGSPCKPIRKITELDSVFLKRELF